MPDAETTTAAPAEATTPSSRTKKLTQWQEVQDTVSRLASNKGVLAISILNSDGDIVTQQITSAGAARKSANSNSVEKYSSGSGGSGSSNSNNTLLGNPKLLTEMMKNANHYVQSLSGHSDIDIGIDSAGAAGGEDCADENGQDAASSRTKEDISFVRIRTQKDEILVAPKLGYTLVVLQDPTLSSL